jgi:hypothetical protein
MEHAGKGSFIVVGSDDTHGTIDFITAQLQQREQVRVDQ